MTRITGPGIGPGEFQPPASGERRDGYDSRRDGLSGRFGELRNGLGQGMRSDEFTFGDGLTEERENAFRDKMAAALQAGARDEQSGEELPPTKLIAVAGEAALPVMAAAPQSAAAQPASAAPDRSAEIFALVDRVESRIAAELAGQGAQQLTLRLDLPDAAFGISGFSISISADAIDVVLDRGGAAASGEIMAAAQALADRLQQRFARKTVRIHEVEQRQEPDKERAFDEISRIFRTPGAGA